MTIDFSYRSIPDYTMEALQRYVDHHIPTGGFLEAVITNNLREAVGRADENNMRALPEIVAYLYNEAPVGCWGTPQAFESWIRKGRAK